MGTPALFFGFCPGATPTNMVCQCFAAWEKGQTVEMETDVTTGSSARGAVTVTFRVSSGTVSETASLKARQYGDQLVRPSPHPTSVAKSDLAFKLFNALVE